MKQLKSNKTFSVTIICDFQSETLNLSLIANIFIPAIVFPMICSKYTFRKKFINKVTCLIFAILDFIFYYTQASYHKFTKTVWN